MRVRVTENLKSLLRDQERVVSDFHRKAPVAVRRTERYTTTLLRGIARAKAGPHGSAYYKRISGEQTGPLSAEVGPSAPKTQYVGAGYRHGHNTDIEAAAEPAGDKLAEETRKMLGALRW